jgi:outer membrane protein assembly complex protein YaeT
MIGKLRTSIAYFVLTVAAMTSANVHAEEPAEVSNRADLTNLEVDEISLLGITVFSASEVEKVVELSPGDRLDRSKIVLTAKNLQDLYRSNGYEEVRIQTRLVRNSATPKARPVNTLEIAVSEGRPTRISAIEVVYDSATWAKRLESVSSKIGMRAGDVYDREKLLNGYRSLQDALTSYDFLSPRVLEATVEPGSPHGIALPPETITQTAKWVKLRVNVALGDRVSFGFRDNTIFPNSQFAAWIEEQRLLGFSQDYIERIQARFEEEYRKLGFDRIQITVYTSEDRQNQRKSVTYIFNEGPRVEVEHLYFDGNTIFDSEILADKFSELATPAISRGYYVAKDIQKTAEVLIEWMKSQGYLAAKLVSISPTYRTKGDKVDIVIYLYEGEQTIVESVRAEGLTVFPLTDIERILGVKAGTPLNLYALNEGLESLKGRYRNRGYLDFAIRNEGTPRLVVYSQENRAAEVVLELVEGIQYRVTRMEVEGLRKTKLETVMRELEIAEGEVLSEREWLRSEAKLRRLGIFATANIKAYPDPNRADGKQIKIAVEEGSPGVIAGGVGFRNDLGARVFGQIQYGNLWGKGHTALFTANANRRFPNFGDTSFCPSDTQFSTHPNADHCFIEYNLSLGYVWPWFSLGNTTFRPRISLENTQFRNFDALTTALQTSWERSIVRDWGLTGVFTYSLEVIEQYNADKSDDNQRLRIGSIAPTLILDRRDNPLAPSRGTYTTVQWDLARPEFGSQNSPPEEPPIAYSRFQFRNDFYFPLPKSIDFYFSFRTGLEYNLAKPPPEDPENTRYAIPLIKQFSLGGAGSLRGFKEQALYVPDDAVRGSLTYVNYRAQVDFPFAGSMKFGPFVDAANLNLDHYSFGGLRYGVGAGFHYKSPVGPVNFDIGVNPKPRFGEDDYRVHFSIGNI